jgi:hypothetical protein
MAGLGNSRITVRNVGGDTVYVKVSKACGSGQDGYWEIVPGASETWRRCVTRRVTIKAASSPSDDTIFASVDHATAMSTGCNVYNVGRDLVYSGEPGCGPNGNLA